MKTISMKWRGEAVEFTPSFDLFMKIEEKVPLSRITGQLGQAGGGNYAELPMSHVAWILFCCLQHARVPVRTPMDVHEAIFAEDDGLEYGQVLGALIVAYYGASPQVMPKKKITETATTPDLSPISDVKLPNGTG